MTGIIKLEYINVQGVIKLWLARGTNPINIHLEFFAVYDENIISRKMVSVWYSVFTEGPTNLENKLCVGCSHSNKIACIKALIHDVR